MRIMLNLLAVVLAVMPAAGLEFYAGHVLIPVTINGVGPYPCLLDLNAPGPVIDTEVAGFLKLPPLEGVRVTRSTRSGKEIAATAAQVTSMEAGGATARNLAVTTMDLATFKRRLGGPVAGIISGREFGAHLGLDLPAKTIAFSKPETPLAATDPGVINIQLDASGAPVVNATIDGKHARAFRLDTASAASVSMPESVLRELGLFTEQTPRLELDMPPTGFTYPGQTQVRLETIRVAAAELRDPVCALGGDGEPARIGLGFLCRFRLRIDYDAKLARLEAIDPAQPAFEPPLAGYGIGLWKFNGEYWMIYVARNSSAANAGLVTGGILTTVGAQDLKGMGYDAIAALLEPHGGTKINVSVLQGDDVHSVELVSAALLGVR